MRETKKHWRGKHPPGGSFMFNGKKITLHRTLCGLSWGAFVISKKAVTCRNCARILAGYQGER